LGGVISAMLATAAVRLPEGPDWRFEPKVDGYRCLAVVIGGRVRLQSRSGGVMTGWFPTLAGLAELGDDLVVDGEVACCDEAGVARFEWLGGWRGGHGTGTVRFFPFDLLAWTASTCGIGRGRSALTVSATWWRPVPLTGARW
jgi:bifunctional non-homologous end joining protein LigD